MKSKHTEHQSKGILRIDTTDNSSFQVVFEPVESTVWLRKSELTTLFQVNIQAVNVCLTSIIKADIIDVDEACKYDLHVSGNRIRYDVRELRLDAIIAMAFRINSTQAKVLREWFIGRCLHPGISCFPFDIDLSCCLN